MSSAGLHFNPERIRQAIMRGVVEGVNDVSIELGKTVREMLSRPGGGRVYFRGGKPKAAVVRDLAKAGIRARFGPGFAYVSRSQATALLRSRRSRGLKNQSLRKLGMHKASAPGEPPAADTGNLRRSWQTGFGNPNRTKGDSKFILRVGSSVEYARRLEFGDGTVAPRPYIRPSIAIVRPKAKPMIVAAIAAEIAKLGRKS